MYKNYKFSTLSKANNRINKSSERPNISVIDHFTIITLSLIRYMSEVGTSGSLPLGGWYPRMCTYAQR